jgi:hypothetical protein
VALDWIPIDPIVDLGARHSISYSPLFGSLLLFSWSVWKWEKRKISDRRRDLSDLSRDRRDDQIERYIGLTRTRMFPLSKREVGGYRFNVRTWYSLHHLGVDYRAVNVPLYAPSDGEIIYEGYGPQGGNMIYFRPDKATVIIRFLHLSKYSAPKGRVVKGQEIGITGNSGMLSTGPHLHLDINVNPAALLSGNLDIANFIDPEQYEWNPVTTVPVETQEPAQSAPEMPQAKVYEPFTEDLNHKYGNAYNAEVARIQSYLIDKNFMKREDLDWDGQVGAGSGWYGKKTSAAVDAFQKAADPGPVVTADKDHFGWWWPKTREKANHHLTIN